MLFKIDFSWFPGDQSGDQWSPTEFQGRGGTKENCLGEYLKHGRFLPVFRGKIKVGDQSSPAEKKRQIIKNWHVNKEGEGHKNVTESYGG